MKIILLVLIIFISGCSSSHKLNITNIQTISYNNINLIENDFDNILNEINKLEFTENKINVNSDKNLKIVSNEKIYNFKINDDSIYYEDNNKIYISENINNLNTILKEIENKYTNFSFFEITYNKCDIGNESFIIKIDNTNNCLTLNTDKTIYNLRINSLISIDGKLSETNLLYQNDEIKKSHIIIKLDILGTYKTKISFDTEYNYTVTMLPIYNKESNNIELNISNIQKK